MPLRTDPGCEPLEPHEKDPHKLLLQVFSPALRFASYERFFPVDLPSTVAHSSLWTVDYTSAAPPGAHKICNTGQISSPDLAAATPDDYTTVAGTGTMVGSYGGDTTDPVPLNKQVLQAYTDGTIPAEMTMYGTVCSAAQVTGADMVRNAEPRSQDVAAAVTGYGDGLLLNYYLYFPYYESPEFESEGDWSGVSLLLGKRPSDVAPPPDVQQSLLDVFRPLLTCYYRKTPLHWGTNYVADVKGFRRWDDVERVPDPTVGAPTHPVVYVSWGRHNCYYEPNLLTIPLKSPWYDFSTYGIEEGKYTAGPASKILEGGGAEEMPLPKQYYWVYALFPPLFFFTMCATGCKWPFGFDTSGLPFPGAQEAQDATDPAGFGADPVTDPTVAGSSYPTAGAGQASSKAVKVALRYVDLGDPDTAAQWGYPGAWGGANMVKDIQSDLTTKPLWGRYQGVRRPKLPAWFMWNLLHNDEFGCGSKSKLTPIPGSW